MTGAPKKIKVCFVAPKAYPIFNPDKGTYFGGAEVDLYYLATEFARDNNFETSFIVADYGQKDVEIIEDVAVFKSLDFRRNALNGLLRTWNALKKADADIYFLKCASAGVPLVTWFCKLHKRKFIYRLASSLESDGTFIKQNPIIGRLFAWSLRQAAIVFSQNSVDADNLMKTIGVSAQVIPNGHRLTSMHEQTRDIVLWVGRDVPVKNPECFLELAKAFHNENFTIVCQTLNNDGHYEDLIAKAGEIQNLRFIRHVPFNQIDTYFQRARVFVNTSHSEGFPNTFIQACKSGTAILSFKVNPDGFLDKFDCGICCQGDFAKMVDSLKHLLSNEAYFRLGKNGRQYVEERHDIIKIADQYKSIFYRLYENAQH
jgi:glycosyltransferase involved in cell wall biosynthesis